MPQVSIKFDGREMDAALKKLALVSDKLPSELVNQKSYRIFQKSVWGMKAVEKSTIDRELGATPAQLLKKLKSGKYSRAKKNIRQFFGQGDGDSEGFPLAAAIIQARAGRSGKPSPWKGVDRATGAQAMLDAVRKMYGARQKSRAYFKATFATIRDVFKRAGAKKGLNIGNENVRGANAQGRIADAQVAPKNKATATAKFWLESPKHDIKDALEKYASPVLQSAMDTEANSTAQHADEIEFKNVIKALGIRVT